MDKEVIHSLIDKCHSYGWHYAVETDENFNYSTRNAFLIWDDSKEVLTIISPNQDTIEVANANNRGSITVVQYSRIVFITAIPDLSKINDWIGDFVKDEELKTKVVDNLSILTDKNYFIS